MGERSGPPSDSTPGGETWRGMTPSDRGFTTPMVDDVFAALSDWRRRAACRYLATTPNNSTNVEALSRSVAQRGQVSAIDDAETTVEAVEAALVEEHLPALHDLGVLDFDERSGSVKYWGAPTVEKWTEHVDTVTQRTEF